MPRRHAQQIQTAREARAVREREVGARPRQIIAENEAQRTVGDARCKLPGAGHLERNRRTMIEGQQQRRAMAGNPVE
jgi:hypothetical protein